MSALPTPMKAIRLKCLDCTCQQAPEVRLCEAEDCPLWPYRFGTRPSTLARRAEARAQNARNCQKTRATGTIGDVTTKTRPGSRPAKPRPKTSS